MGGFVGGYTREGPLPVYCGSRKGGLEVGWSKPNSFPARLTHSPTSGIIRSSRAGGIFGSSGANSGQGVGVRWRLGPGISRNKKSNASSGSTSSGTGLPRGVSGRLPGSAYPIGFSNGFSFG
jgi:hypothetical protein